MAVIRAARNPILGPGDVRPSQEDFEVIGVFNAGVARYGDEVILLLRVAERPIHSRLGVVLSPIYDVQAGRIVNKPFARDDPQNDFLDPRLIVRSKETYLTSISHLRLARGADSVHPLEAERGVRNGESTSACHGRFPIPHSEFRIRGIPNSASECSTPRFHVADAPAIGPANEYETFGIEDPRIACIDDTYYIDYVAVSPMGVTTCLASTRDFETFQRHGVIFHPDNKDVAIFPDRIAGRYYALHRPHSSLFARNDIWLAESPDLIRWGNHRRLIGTRDGLWDEARIGAGAVPVRIDEGWLEIYHGADRKNRYCMGALLLDAEQPDRVLARSERPLFEPQADYEQSGFFGHVVFSCGLLLENDTLKIYYGAADTSIAYAEIPLADVYENLGLLESV